MKGSIYAGNSDQFDEVLAQMVADLGERKSGIFVVCGGPMVGKNTVVEKVLIEIGELSMSFAKDERPRDLTTGDPTQHDLPTILNERIEHGHDTFFFGETSPEAVKVMEWLKSFYEVHKHQNIKLVFNVMSREEKPWNSTDLRRHLETKLKIYFDSQDLHVYYLDADLDTFVEGMWQLSRAHDGQNWEKVSDFAVHFGLNVESEDWNDLIECKDEASFRRILTRMLDGEQHHPSIERW